MRPLNKNNGYAVLVVLLFVGLSGLILSASLQRTTTASHSTYKAKVRSQLYYETEASTGRVISWLRQNSQKLVTPYRRNEFYDRFDKTAPSTGANDTANSPVLTKVKLQGSNNSAILTNDPSLGTSNFPTTSDITTNSVYNAPAEFAAADFGDTMVRVTLIDARADIPGEDFGDTDLGNAMPGTDFYPVYLVEAYAGDNENVHLAATVVGDVVHVFDLGIYGQDYLEINQPCDSFISSAGNYSNATKRANCPAGSNSTSSIHKNEEIYGSLQTNGDIDADPPYGGDTCADFTAGCPNKGETCAGEDCGVPLLEIYSPFNTYCPVDQGDLVVAADQTLTIVDSNLADPEVLPADRCWDELTVSNNTTLTLDSTNSPYYFRTLTLQNNSNSVLDVQPDPAGGKVEIWVENITGNSFNGNQMLNNGNPTSLRIYYLGANDLTLNGTAAINAGMVAPNAAVTVSGSFDYQGALLAKELELTGSGEIHYDESLGGSGDISNIQYELEDMTQMYR